MNIDGVSIGDPAALDVWVIYCWLSDLASDVDAVKIDEFLDYFSTVGPFRPLLDEHMKRDAIAHIRQNQPGYEHAKGGIGMWTYSTSKYKGDPVRGGELWEEFTRESIDYYIKRNQQRLIQQEARWLHELVGEIDLLADFGCGGIEAVRQQIVPLLEEFESSSHRILYVPIDTNGEFVDHAKDVVRQSCHRVMTHGLKGDFMHGLEFPPVKKLGTFFGASTNYATFPDGMINLLDAFRKALGKKSHIAMTIDTNVDPVSIKKSYSHELHGLQIINVMQLFARDLHMRGDFDPDAWVYETDVKCFEWQGFQCAEVLHIMRSTRNQYMEIDGVGSLVHKDEPLAADKSYKMSIDLLSSLAMDRNYRLKGCRYDDQGWMALPVLQIL